MRDTNNYINDGIVSGLIDLIENSPNSFNHLQVFLHRERDKNAHTNNEYLMVTHTVLGKVKVLDLKVEGNFINIEFLDCTMQETGNIRINIDDKKPSVLFICWQDIRKMVLDETQTIINDEILEFDF